MTSTSTGRDPARSRSRDGPLHERRALAVVERLRFSRPGTFTLKAATPFSVNTVLAQVAAQLGPEKIVDMAHLLGHPVATWSQTVRSRSGWKPSTRSR